MKIAIIGGGAAGMATAHYLDKQCDVTVFEKQPMLGGNIRTLNKQLQKVVLPVIDGFEVVQVKDIIRCQANGNFTDFFLENGSKKMNNRRSRENRSSMK